MYKLTSLFVLITLLALGVWGFIIEPRFLLDVQKHDVEVPNLGSDWEGKKVVLAVLERGVTDFM
ncbi:hypothetical protein CK503_08855 [Aliifodinibius salipaludis]|uniref:Uncharacterized protein n=1 Tax=Fodinibius salipaludis TaxID=2032627 RepID=A0A2A2GAE7_9BACT|nr:hypothetical protein [Aliifodinibius salipaludis]PAU94308.1 hypothetical protein CK503_08855 [Aliifodinibius salipaludis]